MAVHFPRWEQQLTWTVKEVQTLFCLLGEAMQWELFQNGLDGAVQKPPRASRGRWGEISIAALTEQLWVCSVPPVCPSAALNESSAWSAVVHRSSGCSFIYLSILYLMHGRKRDVARSLANASLISHTFIQWPLSSLRCQTFRFHTSSAFSSLEFMGSQLIRNWC